MSLLDAFGVFDTNWRLAGARRPPATDEERRLMETLIVKKLTAILEDAVSSADERISVLAAREFEAAVRVHDAAESSKRVRALPAKHPARETVKRGGRLCEAQVFLGAEERAEEVKAATTFAVELPGSRMAPVREAEFVEWLDAALITALQEQGIAARLLEKKPEKLGVGVTVRRKGPTS